MTYLHDIYLIGSLRNPQVPVIENKLTKAGFKVFAEWFAGGRRADEEWRLYEIGRGHTYKQALDTAYAKHVFGFDKFHIDASRTGVLVLPAGRSAHLELGYMSKDKPTFILLEEESQRYDVMYQFATGRVYTVRELILKLGEVCQT